MKKKPKKDKPEPGDLTGGQSDEWCGIHFSSTPSGLILPQSNVPPEHESLGQVWFSQACDESTWDDTAYMASYTSTTQKLNRIIEQQVLRLFHRNRMEYAWSETLQAHVAIGEPLR